jgi:membrane fusion protein (multidrug efflux system)
VGCFEAKGKTQPTAGRRALLAPVPLHPVTEVRVQPGDRVKKGQVLIQLDDDEPQADVRAKKAVVESNRLYLKEARRYLAAVEGLHASGALPEVTYHQARLNEAQANQAEKGSVAALESSKAELEHYTVTAPIDGVVAWLDVAPGMVSRPGTTVWGEILDLSEIDVHCELPADLADRVAAGQTAEVVRESKGWGTTVWTGEVVSVGVAADERTGLVPVRVRLKDAKERLRCRVEVEVRFGSGAGVAGGPAPKGGPR